MRPWTSLGLGHVCSVVKRTRPWSSLGFGHGCSVVKTDQTMDVIRFRALGGEGTPQIPMVSVLQAKEMP